MKEKVLQMLELNDDREGIENIAIKVIKKNPIDIYTDYRDFEGIEKFVGECDDQFDFEDKIIESYDECVFEDLCTRIAPVIDELHKHYEFDDVSDDLYEHLQELVNDNTEINYPLNDYL